MKNYGDRGECYLKTTRAHLGVCPGGPGPPFVQEFFSSVNICWMVLQALLLKYIFFNKLC